MQEFASVFEVVGGIAKKNKDREILQIRNYWVIIMIYGVRYSCGFLHSYIITLATTLYAKFTQTFDMNFYRYNRYFYSTDTRNSLR